MFPYQISNEIQERLRGLRQEVNTLPRGQLSQRAIKRVRDYFRIHHIYHSNAIEGNSLTLSETRVVVQEGLTISGKPLKDHTEAVNLNAALDYVEEYASNPAQPLGETLVKHLHLLVLRGIDNENAGKYRGINVRIQGSEHMPPEAIFVPEQMEEFGKWLESSSDVDPVLRSAAAHTWLVSIHPFVDGNGRTARLLMNLILTRAEYPIAIIRKEDRASYYQSLEKSRGGDLSEFVDLVIDRITETLSKYREAIEEDSRAQEWAATVAKRTQTAALRRKKIEYDIWRRAMELLRSQFEHRVEVLTEPRTPHLEVGLRTYDTIDFEKYESLRARQSAPLTWFFGLRFKFERKEEKFMFFFGWPGHEHEKLIGAEELSTVILRISKWTGETYEVLDTPHVRLREVVFWKEEFYPVEYDPVKDERKMPGPKRPAQIALEFFEDVLNNLFGV